MKTSKKLISLLLSLLMLMSSLSIITVLATDDKQATFGGHTYRLFDESMTWKEAKEYCEQLGGYLATVTSAQEQEVVKNLIASGEKAQYWLGGTDEGTLNKWRWVTGEDFTYWADTVTFETNDNGEYYLQMQRHNWGNDKYLGYWNNANNENHINGEEDFYGPDKIGFVCEFGDSEMPTENNTKMPIVYIIGRTAIVKADGSPTIEENTSFITDVVAEAMPYLTDGILKNEWDPFCDAVYEQIASRYEDYRLNNEGEVDNGTHNRWTWNEETLPGRQGDIFTYRFEYDARKDPCVIADDLNDYIQAIKEKTGYDKVHIISRCLGCNIAAAYFAEYGYEDIATNIMFASAAKGYDFVGQLFAGKIAFNDDSINYWLDENDGFELDDGKIATELAKATVAYAQNKGLLAVGTAIANRVYATVSGKIFQKLMVATYGTSPGYWAMVNDENYEEAKKQVFGDEIDTTYKVLCEKIDNYHYNVQNPLEGTLKAMAEDGVKMNIICKYGFQTPPFIEDSRELSDNRIEVSAQSFGATTVNTNEEFCWLYMLMADINGTKKYISPDKKIDSSTALFPDYTWYIKNVEHNPFHDCFNPLMLQMCYSEEQMTVDSDENWPQYLFYNPDDGTCTPLNKDNMNTEDYTDNNISAFVRFIKALFAFLKEKIQNGTVN
ncbi:MAG: lectin-like protein [Acutalibacteraceae bacterium]